MEPQHIITTREVRIADSREAASLRLTGYLESVGYRKTSEDPLEFERGSARGTPFAFSPRKWHSVVRVSYAGAPGSLVAALAFDLDATGQLVSAREARFFESESAAVEAALLGSQAPSAEGAGRSAATAAHENIRSVVVLLLSMLGAAGAVLLIMILIPRALLKPLRFIVLPGAFGLAIWFWSRYQARVDRRAKQEFDGDPPVPTEPP